MPNNTTCRAPVYDEAVGGVGDRQSGRVVASVDGVQHEVGGRFTLSGADLDVDVDRPPSGMAHCDIMQEASEVGACNIASRAPHHPPVRRPPAARHLACDDGEFSVA